MGNLQMNVSKYEQRVLHALAQGGRIVHRRDDSGRVVEVDCWTRDGFRLADCTVPSFHKLRRRRLICSVDGHPYRVSRLGLAAVRAQLDNR
jgi:uncharacterized protein YjhX (UPF0386 family)